MIISQSVRIDAANHMGLTPLIRAARRGQDVVVRALLDAGACITRHTTRGMTPVIAAASGGFVNLMSWLINKHNAPIIGIPNKLTTITSAAKNGHTCVIEVLVHIMVP